MELNKDCVRDILLYVKKYCGDPNSHIGKTTLDVSLDELCKSEQCSKYEIRIISYTIEQLEEYGLIKLGNNNHNSVIDKKFKNLHIHRLTPKGHEFIDNLADDEDWNKVKTAIKNAGKEDCSLNIYFEYIHNNMKEQVCK